MWCHLMPEDDARYIFHDSWTRATWRGGTRTSHAARRRCDVYMRACLQAHVCAQSEASATAARRALPLDGIDEFVTFVEPPYVLDGLTSAELESLAHRHGLTFSESSSGRSGGGGGGGGVNKKAAHSNRRASILAAIATASDAAQIHSEARAYLSAMNRAPVERRMRGSNMSKT